MANVNDLAPLILKWEGGFVNDPKDRGGATNMGVTLNTWKRVGYDKDKDGDIDVKDLKLLSKEDVVKKVLKPYYWDKWRADEINNQSIANILVDWVYTSGKYGITKVQAMLNLKPDGVVGNKTLSAINDYPNQRQLFQRIKNERLAFIDRIVKNNPSQRRFLKGWKNRVNAFKYFDGGDGKQPYVNKNGKK